MKTVCIGVDFGTSVVKATALDSKSGNRHQISSAYSNRAERSTPQGWSSVLERTLTTLLDELGRGVGVGSLAITAMVPNVALHSGQGRTLGSMLFCDNDAYPLELELDAHFKSAKWANEVLSKMLFLSRKTLSQSFRWFTTHNWLVHDLTGAFVIDSVTAGECGTLIDASGGWDRGIVSQFDLPSNCLPEIVAPTTIVGTVRATYPVPALRGVPVIAGTSDTVATAVGAGWGDERDSLLVYYGTFNCAARIQRSRTEVLEGTVAKNPFDWVLSIPQAGVQLAHIADLIGDGQNASERLHSLDVLASGSPPGSNGVVFLHSDDITQTTVSSSPKGSLRYLEPHHTRGDISRSVLEGFAYLLRWSLAQEKRNIVSLSSILAAGGGAKSGLWRQIVSDVSGLTQLYRPSADRGLGSAWLALAALSPSALKPLEAILAEETLTTRPSATAEYENAYSHYMESWLSSSLRRLGEPTGSQ